MSTTINTGWLKNNNGEKFAPKTLSSQVLTNDGTSIESKLYSDLAIMENEIKSYSDSVTLIQTEFSEIQKITSEEIIALFNS